ncbi:MAG: hypothetical protein JJT78_02805 [Leptospira sp.]|nr:hypothetical protein [Leptospira sp.]
MSICKYIIPLLFIFLSGMQDLHSEKNAGRIYFNPESREGYFQGWNFYFKNNDTTIFVTFLVSNLGPGSLNNGISLYINHPKTGKYYRTKEYADFDLEATAKKFGQRSGENRMSQDGSKYMIEMKLEDLELDMKWDAKNKNIIPISGGNYPLKKWKGFLRADIGFASSPAIGELRFKGEKFTLVGDGGMEHLNTNVEVYKFSNSWEILRAIAPDKSSIYFGGFNSSKYEPFKRIILTDPAQNIILEDDVATTKAIKSVKNSFSGYTLPVIQELTLKKNKECKITIEDNKNLGEISILSNISAVLKFFIRLFFAKPYQIHFQSKVTMNCGEKKWEFNKGLHSYYLINPE